MRLGAWRVGQARLAAALWALVSWPCSGVLIYSTGFMSDGVVFVFMYSSVQARDEGAP